MTAVVVGTSASLASASQPVPFATVDGTCPSGYQDEFYGTPVTGEHPNVTVRYSVSSGQAGIDGEGTLTAGALQWNTGQALSINDTPTVTDYNCFAEHAAFEATFYDTPTAPTTYTGAGDSYLPFITSGTAQYVADVQLTDGGVEVYADYGNSARYASSGQYPMGTLAGAGVHGLHVVALDGPRPKWTITIRPLPVAISGLKFASPLTRPGPVVEADYTTSGDTNITATVTNSAGTPVRSIASGLSVSDGQHSLVWDGRAADGSAVADGAYRLTLTSTDPMGMTSSAATSITVDGTPPSVAMSSPATLAPSDPVIVQASDALSGLDDLQVSDPADQGYAVAETRSGGGSVSYQPYEDWSLGAHTLRATATDKLGNARAVDIHFMVANPQSVTKPTPTQGKKKSKKKSNWPRCSHAAAKRTVAHNAAFLRAVRHRGLVKKHQSPFAHGRFSLGKVICRDLTRDKHKDMAVLLNPPTTGVMAFAVFKATTHGWHLGYKRTTGQEWKLKARGRRLYWNVPHYRRTDALCCPSGKFRHYVLSYRNGRFHAARRK